MTLFGNRTMARGSLPASRNISREWSGKQGPIVLIVT